MSFPHPIAVSNMYRRLNPNNPIIEIQSNSPRLITTSVNCSASMVASAPTVCGSAMMSSTLSSESERTEQITDDSHPDAFVMTSHPSSPVSSVSTHTSMDASSSMMSTTHTDMMASTPSESESLFQKGYSYLFSYVAKDGQHVGADTLQSIKETAPVTVSSSPDS